MRARGSGQRKWCGRLHTVYFEPPLRLRTVTPQLRRNTLANCSARTARAPSSRVAAALAPGCSADCGDGVSESEAAAEVMRTTSCSRAAQRRTTEVVGRARMAAWMKLRRVAGKGASVQDKKEFVRQSFTAPCRATPATALP